MSKSRNLISEFFDKMKNEREYNELTARQKLATILRHHCQPKELSKAVTTGAKTIVPNPEPQVEIPVTKDLFFSNQ